MPSQREHGMWMEQVKSNRQNASGRERMLDIEDAPTIAGSRHIQLRGFAESKGLEN